ncbi:YybH family protein [Pseudonocardia spinosispora]|uniref:YybH family protein n=1 Tax=Pseudonocardia spinosispora TaxID=103441 RepID=UPI000420736D|nr:ketosteroid isomerase family protein [Pseudonocardia spinosispora]
MTTDLFSTLEITDQDVARQPEDLPGLFVRLANAGDVDGLVGLYEGDAVLTTPEGVEIRGAASIGRYFSELLASAPVFTLGEQRPVLRLRDVALTSTRLGPDQATAEVARRQLDGTWRWVSDRPDTRR